MAQHNGFATCWLHYYPDVSLSTMQPWEIKCTTFEWAMACTALSWVFLSSFDTVLGTLLVECGRPLEHYWNTVQRKSTIGTLLEHYWNNEKNEKSSEKQSHEKMICSQDEPCSSSGPGPSLGRLFVLPWGSPKMHRSSPGNHDR